LPNKDPPDPSSAIEFVFVFFMDEPTQPQNLAPDDSTPGDEIIIRQAVVFERIDHFFESVFPNPSLHNINKTNTATERRNMKWGSFAVDHNPLPKKYRTP
jgi:hypothetical protein